MNEEILKELKSRLDITWEDNITNNKLSNIIKNSIPKLNRLIGVETINYTNKGFEEELDLLLNYCMYAWENKSELFKTNYIDDILSLRQKYEVEDYRQSEENNDEDIQ